MKDEQLLREVQLAVKAQIDSYMDRKQGNLKSLGFKLGVSVSDMNRIYFKDNNFTIRRLIDLAAKTDAKLVISFEPLTTQKQ